MDAERPRDKVPIPGTDGWLRVTTTHGNVFYAQKKTKRSEWTVPEEIRAQVEAMDGRPPKRARTASPAAEPRRADDTHDTEDSEAELVPEPAAEPSAEPAAAPAAPAAPIPMAPELSFDEGRALFLTMLSSLNGTAHEINPMAPWDRELPKFVHLPAYSALRSTRDREDVFNEWCKLRLREKREQGRTQPSAPAPTPRATPSTGAGASDAARALRALFKKHVVSTRTTFADVQRKWGADPRFTAVPEPEARAVLDAWLAELAEIKRTLARKADDAFGALLTEKLPPPAALRAAHHAAHPDPAQAAAIWASAKKTPGLVEDKRYDAVGSATRRAELFAQWVRRGDDAADGGGEAPAEAPAASTKAPTETPTQAPTEAPTSVAASSTEARAAERRERLAQMPPRRLAVVVVERG